MFQIETSLIFWSAVSFSILLLLLKKWALPPLLQLMEARRAKIESDLSYAQAAQAEAAALSAQSQQKLQAAKQRAEKIITDTTQRAQAQKEEIINKAESRAGQIVDQARLKTQTEAQKARTALQAEITSLVVEAGSKIIPQALSDADHLKIIEAGLKELEKTA
jgi:F-type H+-transporting ATPase subunit b